MELLDGGTDVDIIDRTSSESSAETYRVHEIILGVTTAAGTIVAPDIVHTLQSGFLVLSMQCAVGGPVPSSMSPLYWVVAMASGGRDTNRSGTAAAVVAESVAPAVWNAVLEGGIGVTQAAVWCVWTYVLCRPADFVRFPNVVVRVQLLQLQSSVYSVVRYGTTGWGAGSTWGMAALVVWCPGVVIVGAWVYYRRVAPSVEYTAADSDGCERSNLSSSLLFGFVWPRGQWTPSGILHRYGPYYSNYRDRPSPSTSFGAQVGFALCCAVLTGHVCHVRRDSRAGEDSDPPNVEPLSYGYHRRNVLGGFTKYCHLNPVIHVCHVGRNLRFTEHSYAPNIGP
jgi:hypothetical protein